LVREALEAHLAGGAPRKRRAHRRSGAVLKALSSALAASTFEERDAGAVGLARHLASQLDEKPSDSKYLAARLLAVLVELRLTPAARMGILAAEKEAKAPTGLDALRLVSAARAAGETGLVVYLMRRSDAVRDAFESFAGAAAAQRHFDATRDLAEAVTDALAALEASTSALEVNVWHDD
jgi:hypothetical protein